MLILFEAVIALVFLITTLIIWKDEEVANEWKVLATIVAAFMMLATIAWCIL